MGQVTALGENWVNPATGGSLFQILDAGGIAVGGVPIFSPAGLPLFSLEVSPEYASLQGYPLLTVNPTGSTSVPNNGSNYGPQTTFGSTSPYVVGAPYSTSSGFQEFMNSLPTSSQDQSNAYAGFLMPGVLNVVTNTLVCNASNMVLMGSGKNSVSVKWGGGTTLPSTSFGGPSSGWSSSPAGAPAYSSSCFWYFPNAANSGATGSNTATEGTYLGFLGIDLGGTGKAWNYGLCIGNPGGNIPDICAASLLLEHLRVQGDGGVSGINTNIQGPQYSTAGSPSSYNYLPLYNSDVVMSSYEDALLLQCDFGGGPVEWIINNGSSKIVGGNMGNSSSPLVVPSLNISLVDAVLCIIVVGNAGTAGAPVTGQLANTYIDGCGFNGAPVSNIQVVPMNASANKYHRLTCNGIDVTLQSATPANSGYIGTYVSSSYPNYLLGCNLTMATFTECHFTAATTGLQPLFVPSGNGWATLVNCHLSGNGNQNMPGFLGSGSFIWGNLLDRSAKMWFFQNGAVSQQGLISTPFGTAVTTWGGSSGNAVGPGVSSGSASPTSGTTYTVAFVPQIIVSSGGSSVTITVYDSAGNQIATGMSALAYPGAYLPVGYQIKFAYSSAPTVSVYGC